MDNQISQKQKQWTIIATILASGVVFLSSSIVNVALPVIGEALDTGLSGLQWVVDSYLLTLSSLLILGGAFGDRFGRRRMCVIGLIGFGLTQIGSGFSPNIGWLIGFRAVQGISGALMVPESLAILRSVFVDPEERGKAIGAWSGWTGIATVIGPLLGGYMVEALSWRWAFFISIPLILLSIYLMIRFVPPSQRQSTSANLDWIGSVIVTLGLGGIAYGFIEGPVVGWTSPSVLIGLIGGLFMLAVFPVVESRLKRPLLPLSLFESRNFSGANLATLAIYAALQGSSFLIVLYIQNVMGYSALVAGLMTAPISLLLLLLSSTAGRLSNKYGPRLFMTFGPIVTGIGLALLAMLNPDSNIWLELIPAIVIFGLGLASTVAPLTDTVLSAAPEKHSSVAAAFNTMVSRVAALLAVAAFGAILSLGFSNDLNQRLAAITLPEDAAQQLQAISEEPSARIDREQLPEDAVRAYELSYTSGYRQAMFTGAILAVIGGVISYITIRNPDQKEKAKGKENPT